MRYTKYSSQAKRIDTLDAIVGVGAALCMWSGSEFLHTLGTYANLAELAFVKLPFMLDYVSATKDKKSLLFWVPKEIIANTTAIGSFMDVAPSYTMRVDYFTSRR